MAFSVDTLNLGGQDVKITTLVLNQNLAGLMSSGDANSTYLVTGSSGSFYLSTNPNNFSSSGNVETTGTNAVNLIKGLSGQLDISGGNLNLRVNTLYSSTYITGIMLSGSGQSFTGQIFFTGAGDISIWNSGQLIFISGNTGGLLAYYNNSNPLNFSSSGNVENTGTNLQNTFNNLGVINSVGGIPVFSGKVGNTGLSFYSLSGSSGIYVQKSGLNNNISIGVWFQSGQSLNIDPLQIYATGYALKPLISVFETGWGPNILGPAIYTKQITFIAPAATNTQTIIGDTTSTAGTLTTNSTEILGDFTDFAPAGTGFAVGGCGTTTTHIYRGTMQGRNGFFFYTKFLLTGSNNSGNYGIPSGSRIFIGLTDQTVTNSVLTNDPPGNRVGLMYQWASGGSQTGNFMSTWQISTKNNVTQSTGNTTMLFLSGFYRFTMYCKPYPDNGIVYWQLDDLIRLSGCAGSVTATLPVGSTSMRPCVAVNCVSGNKGIGLINLYVETPSIPNE